MGLSPTNSISLSRDLDWGLFVIIPPTYGFHLSLLIVAYSSNPDRHGRILPIIAVTIGEIIPLPHCLYRCVSLTPSVHPSSQPIKRSHSKGVSRLIRTPSYTPCLSCVFSVKLGSPSSFMRLPFCRFSILSGVSTALVIVECDALLMPLVWLGLFLPSDEPCSSVRTSCRPLPWCPFGLTPL